jgi:hypothetical protein
VAKALLSLPIDEETGLDIYPQLEKDQTTGV